LVTYFSDRDLGSISSIVNTKLNRRDDISRVGRAILKLEIKIEFGLKFDQSEQRKLIFSLVNFAFLGQISIRSEILI